LQADYVTDVEDRPIISVKYCIPVPAFHFWPKLSHLFERYNCWSDFTDYSVSRKKTIFL